ncbi:salutaridinol 7-o-acetyltransferase [Quercus suber]|uniref:Salutaridinol 7-o-acetyltransferase n=1 Tax=Quercus suber TaxID=58331 RepID=A0AAW0KKD9_QUESU
MAKTLATFPLETLTQYYPLAGKIKDDLCINCNDEGAYFVGAQVNFLHCELILKESAGTYVTNIQVNVFKCGGIAIGVCISHKILDGVALSGFLKAWATIARGSYKVKKRNSVMYESFKEIGGGLGSKEEANYFGFGILDSMKLILGEESLYGSGSSGSLFMNLVILADTRLGDGIEPWVTLDEQEMARLECKLELLTFA